MSNESPKIFRWAALVYQVLAGIAIVLGFVWALSSWRAGVDSKLDSIHQALSQSAGCCRKTEARIDAIYQMLRPGPVRVGKN